MAELFSFLQPLATGIASAAITSATAITTVFRDVKRRLDELEAKVGVEKPVPTGLFLTVSTADEVVRKLRRQVDSWDFEPPDWAVRLLRPRATSTTMNTELLQDLEERLDSRIKTLSERVRELENIDNREHSPKTMVSRSEYERDSRSRADEIKKIQESLAAANGFLRGVMAVLGYLDEPKTTPTVIRKPP